MLAWGAGVHYSMHYSLPGATMLLSNTTVVIQNSIFSELSWRGQAALVLKGSDVTFFNTTFLNNNNSRGARRHCLLLIIAACQNLSVGTTSEAGRRRSGLEPGLRALYACSPAW